MFDLNKRGWLKLFCVAFLATMFRVIIQLFIPSTSQAYFPPSIIVNAGLLPLVFTVYAFFGYSLLGIVFVLIQRRLPFNKLVKGLVFGGLFALMWVAYLFEPLPSASGSVVDLLSYPLADGSGLVCLGLLLGLFLASKEKQPHAIGINRKTAVIVVFPLVFVVIRVLGYLFLPILSSFITSPLQTLIWAAITGLSIGLMYSVLSMGIEAKSPFAKAALFAVVVFGIDLFFFNFFIPLVFEISLLDIFLRGLIDVLSVLIGAFIYEKLGGKQ